LVGAGLAPALRFAGIQSIIAQASINWPCPQRRHRLHCQTQFHSIATDNRANLIYPAISRFKLTDLAQNSVSCLRFQVQRFVGRGKLRYLIFLIAKRIIRSRNQKNRQTISIQGAWTRRDKMKGTSFFPIATFRFRHHRIVPYWGEHGAGAACEACQRHQHHGDCCQLRSWRIQRGRGDHLF
jgi:hypothetical protein